MQTDMACGWHDDCDRPIVTRVRLPYGYVWACKEALSEYNSLVKPTRVPTAPRYVQSALTSEEIASLNLTKNEKAELASMDENERNGVLHLLLEVKDRKKRAKNRESGTWQYKTSP